MQEGTTNIPQVAYTTRVTRKGQVTIPIDIRRALRIEEGDAVSFNLDHQTVTLTPRTSVVDATAGVFAPYVKRRRESIASIRRHTERAIAEEVIRRSR